MMSVFKKYNKEDKWLPRLQAHRGYWVSGLTQNSLEAIQEAYKKGYEMCEFDVSFTKDHVVILYHDWDFNGKLVTETNYLDLKQQLNLTLLNDVLFWLNTVEKFKLNIEIKSKEFMSLKFEKTILNLIKKFNLEDRVIISSFNPISLLKVQKLNNKIRVAYLLSLEKSNENWRFLDSKLLFMFLKPYALHLRFKDLKEAKVFRGICNYLQIPVVLWTVNNMQDYLNIRNKVHGVISDRITPESLSFKD